jgi:protoporphyrinogen oxidase
MTKEKPKPKAVILGAGVSGLVSAWRLLERGWQVEIFEKETAYGGMSRSWRWKEFIIDVGPHLFHTPDPEMAEFWEREFGDLFVKGDFWCCNVKGDKFEQYYYYPLSYEGFSKYPKEIRQRIIQELEHVNAEERAHARSYREYVRTLVGPTLQEMFFEKYPRKVWGISTDEMTPAWAPKRIQLRQKNTPFYHGQWNAVGKYGAGCIYDRIYQKIIQMGGKVHLGKAVTGIDQADNRITGLKLADDATVAVSGSDLIISSLPINLTARLLGFSSQLTFRGITSVYLAFNKEFVIPEGLHWLYFDSSNVLFNRLSEQKKLSADCAVPGKTCVTAEVAYSVGDEIDKMNPDDLMRRTLEDLIKTGLVKEEEFYAASWHKQPAVYPLLHKDYQHDLAKVQSYLGQFNQLYSIGTTGEFSYADSQILFQKAFDLVDILTNKFSESSQVKRSQTVTVFNPQVALGDKNVGDGQKPFIIAEAGLNHNGSLEMACQLIDRAAEAGCDAIKFQTYKAENRVSGKIKKVRYAETVLGMEETLRCSNAWS